MNKFITLSLLVLFVINFSNVVSQATPADFLDVITTYTLTQNQMDAAGAAALFSPYGVANAPLGTNTVHGSAAIEAFYVSLFNSTTFVKETPNNDYIINENIVAYTKTFVSTWAPNGMLVINWFTFDVSSQPPKILDFSAIWNATASK